MVRWGPVPVPLKVVLLFTYGRHLNCSKLLNCVRTVCYTVAADSRPMDGWGLRARGFPSLHIWYFSLVYINGPKRMWLAYRNDPLITKNVRVKRVLRRTEVKKKKTEMRLRAEVQSDGCMEEDFIPRPKYRYCGTRFTNVGRLIAESVCCYCSMIFMDSWHHDLSSTKSDVAMKLPHYVSVLLLSQEAECEEKHLQYLSWRWHLDI